MKIRHTLVLAALGALPIVQAQAHEPQPATPATAQANRAVAAAYDLASPQDFEDAARGLVATLPGGVIRDAQGNVPGTAGSSPSSGGPRPAASTPACGARNSSTTRRACSRWPTASGRCAATTWPT